MDPPHAVCRQGKCQRGVCNDYCGQDSDCVGGGVSTLCYAATNVAAKTCLCDDDYVPPNDDVPPNPNPILIGGDCSKTAANNNNPVCVIPEGLDHGVCRGDSTKFPTPSCQSGQPGSYCGQTSDCFVQTDLNPPHGVCRGPNSKCQR